jgi:hypothetical protein
MSRELIVPLLISIIFLNSCKYMSPTTIDEVIYSAEDSSLADPDEKTIQSIKRIGDFYTVHYSGDYQERIAWLQKEHARLATLESTPSGGCSLFTYSSDSGDVLFGRNFDRHDEVAVLGFYSPPGKYKSFAFSPFSEISMKQTLKDDDISESERLAFLTSLPFYATDGINENGLAIGVAGVPARKLSHTGTKDPMFVLHFVREVLDNCTNLEDVGELANNVYLYDKSIHVISHHIMIVERSGGWMVIDYPDGVLRITYGTGEPQWRTNHFPEGGPATAEAPDSFKRYRLLGKRLESVNSLNNASEGMELLKDVSNCTAWSVVYELNSLELLISTGMNYSKHYRFGF